MDLEAIRKASLLDEEARHMRTRELAARDPRSGVEFVESSTTEGTNTFVGTTEGVPSEGAGSRKLDPSVC